jgi:CRP-like cAMP-binding protein
MLKTVQKTKPGLKRAFDVSGFLAMVNPRKRIEFRKGQTLFSQGEAARHLYYIQDGSVKLAVISVGGKEAVVVCLDRAIFWVKAAWLASRC